MRERCGTPGTIWATGIHVPHASTVTNDSSTLTPTPRAAPRRAHHCSAALQERFGSVAARAVVCQPPRSTNRPGHNTLGRACDRAQRMSNTGSHPRSRMPAPEAGDSRSGQAGSARSPNSSRACALSAADDVPSFGESQDRVLVGSRPASATPRVPRRGDCWAIAGDRDRGGALRPAPATGTIEASPIRS